MAEQQKPRFYGRRLGRQLRPGRKALLGTLLPTLRLSLDQPINPPSLFATPKEGYWLEIGFGNGEHLAWQAKQHPEIGFIGCEMFVNGVAALLTRIQQESLGNIRICDQDARDLITRLPDRRLDRVFLLFLDPWPKFRHRHRRFINNQTIAQLAALMKKDAELVIATDDPAHLLWILAVMGKSSLFTWLATSPRDWQYRDWPITRYEAKAEKSGRKSCYLRYRRQ